MSSQAQINQPPIDPSGRNGRDKSRRLTGNVAGVIHDITELLELQVKLFAADTRSALRNSMLAVVLIVLAVCTLLGAMPVALMAVAEILVEQAQLSHIEALLVASGAGIGVAVVVLAIAWWRLRRGLQHLHGSFEELDRNVAWIKHVLKNGEPRSRG